MDLYQLRQFLGCSSTLSLISASFSRSAFFVFCSEHRPTVKGEYPGLSIGDIAKKLAEMWSKQSPKDRTPFEQKAAALRQKYEKVNVPLTQFRSFI